VQINAYVTPPQNQGFAPHYDVHDVFVLQVAGRKRCAIHEPVVLDPLDSQPWEGHRAAVEARAAEPALIDAELQPGDALYLPRGTIHSAKALGETSIHLTVGVHPLTRYHLVRQLLESARDVDALRASLPMGVDLTDPSVLAPHLAETVAALLSHVSGADARDAADALGVTLRRQTRPVPIGPLAQLDAAAGAQADTALRLRPGLRATLDGAGIRLLDRTVTVAPAAADAVKTVLAGIPFTPADLPGLDAEEQLALARQLLREGVVVPVEPHP
jgi:ribosomal protein L16 Arg81 hydroxylase